MCGRYLAQAPPDILGLKPRHIQNIDQGIEPMLAGDTGHFIGQFNEKHGGIVRVPLPFHAFEMLIRRGLHGLRALYRPSGI